MFRVRTTGFPRMTPWGISSSALTLKPSPRALWTGGQVCGFSQGELVTIDGKRVRGSYDQWDNKAAIHIVSAWPSSNSVALAQVKVEGNTDENFSIIRKIALNMLSLELAPKLGKKIKQQKSIRNDRFRQRVLKI